MKAPDSAVKECLRIYDPSKPTAQIKTMLKKCFKRTITINTEILNKGHLQKNVPKMK